MKGLRLLLAAFAVVITVTVAQKVKHGDHYDTRDEAIAKLIDRANDVTHGIIALEKKIEHRVDPERIERAGSLEARIESLEEPSCGYHFHQCGGDDPQCVSNLFVCDGHKDCRNGADEDHCDNPFKAGDEFVGDVVYDHCTQRKPEQITLIVKSVTTVKFFTAFQEVDVVIKIPFHNKYEEGVASLPTNAHYSFASHRLIIHSPEDDGLGIRAQFDGYDFDRFVGHIVHEISREDCAKFIFNRKPGDDDN